MNDQAASGSCFELPHYIDRPLEVYVNGIPQTAGVDYELVERTLVFPRELIPEIKMSRVQWVLVAVGIGSYRKHDSLDVIYERDGRRLVATGLKRRES